MGVNLQRVMEKVNGVQCRFAPRGNMVDKDAA